MIVPYECVVMANGHFPETEIPLRLLSEAKTVIACDGAAQTLHEKGIKPNIIIGDMDSLPADLRLYYADRLHTNKDQEINDLTKAVRFAHGLGYKEVLILGATGLREDHTLGNISLLLDYVSMFDRIEMVSDYGIFVPLIADRTFEAFPGQQVSIFTLTPDYKISEEGLRWQLPERIAMWWQATLNEVIEHSFTLHLSPGSKVLVYRCF